MSMLELSIRCNLAVYYSIYAYDKAVAACMRVQTCQLPLMPSKFTALGLFIGSDDEKGPLSANHNHIHILTIKQGKQASSVPFGVLPCS
jgi:hypothetical protein